MFALILDNYVVQVSNERFQVAPPLEWVECDRTVAYGHTYADGVFTAPVPFNKGEA
jgi:hypothetical protein